MGLNLNKLFSNRAINAIDSKTGGFTGGITGTLKNLRGTNKKVASSIAGPEGSGQFTMGQAVYRKEKMGLMDAIKEGHKATGNEISIGGYSAKKMAGSYIGVSAAARIATGGGLYKDRNGETDIIGLPFI